jgi:hypothetical protein
MRFIKIRYLEKYYLEIFYFLLSLIYFITIQYTWVFRKIHETKGFEVDFFFIKYVIITCFVLYTIKFFKKPKSDYFSKNILGVVLILDFIPSSIFYSSTADIDWRIYFFHILLFYSLALTLSFKFNIRIKTLNKKQILIFLLLIVLVGILPYFRYISYINLKNLILIDIYDTRLKFRGLFDTYSGYTHSWLTRVVIPIIFVLSLKYKLKAIAVLNTLLLLFLYLMGAVKSVLLGSLLVVIFYFINKDKILPFITKGLIALLLIAIFSYPFVEHDLNFFSVVVFRRMMFIPSLLDYCYFDFLIIIIYIGQIVFKRNYNL